MTLSRRSTIKTIGVVGAGSALSNSVLAVNQHEDDERDETAQPDEDEEAGAIRVAHFSPDAPAVDVYVNDQQILTDVAYNDVSPYLEIVPGTYTLTVTAAGDEEAVVYEQQIKVGSGFYTAAAIGELGLEDGADGADSLGSNTADAAADENATTNGSDDNSTALETDDDHYGNESGANESVANATDGDSNATDSETGLGAQDESVAADDPLAESGTFDVLLLVDRPEEEVDDAIKGEDAGQVRLVHASPDAPNVAVAVDSGQVLFEDVGFTEPSGYVGIPAGDATLDIYDAADVDGPVVGKMTAETAGDESALNASDTGNVSQDGGSDELDTGAEDEPEPVASVDLEVEQGRAYTVYAIGYLESADGAGGDASAEDESAGNIPSVEDGAANETDDVGNETDGFGNGTTDDAGNETDGLGNETDDAGNETDSGLDSSDETDGGSADEGDQNDRSFETVVLPDGTMEANDTDNVDDDAASEMGEEPMGDHEDENNESELGVDDSDDNNESIADNESAAGNESSIDDESLAGNESRANGSDANASDY